MSELLPENWKLLTVLTVAVLLYVECGRQLAGWAYAETACLGRIERVGAKLIVLAWPLYFVIGVLRALFRDSYDR
jgi:hypothetical protein